MSWEDWGYVKRGAIIGCIAHVAFFFAFRCLDSIYGFFAALNDLIL